MRLTPSLVTLALLAGLPTAAVAAPTPDSAEGTAPTIASLQADLKAAEAAGAAQSAEAAKLGALLDGVSTMLDRRNEVAVRVAAVKSVAETRDARVLSLLWVVSRASSSAVRAAVVDGVAKWDNTEVLTILGDRASARGEQLAIRTKAITALQKTGKPQAAERLYKIAMNPDQTSEARDLAMQALEATFADFLKGKARPKQAADSVGVGTAMIGNALAGGVLLNSVGIWGQGDAAPAIGALGGIAIGAGTAALYAKTEPISRGQGLAYASNTGWGLAGGMMASHFIYGDADTEDHSSMRALLRSTGVGIGVYTGYQRMGRNPSANDVMKTNAAGFVGSQIGRSGTHLVQSFTDTDYDSEDASRIRTVAALGGAAGGLAAGSIYTTQWKPAGPDALFAGVVGVETMVAASMIPTIIDRPDQTPAFMDFGFFAGSTAGLLASHRHPVPIEQTTLIGYGALSGNLFGLGVAHLSPDEPSERTAMLWTMPSGIAGAIAGGWAHQHVKPTEGDWAMVGVGSALTAAQLAAMSFVFLEHDVYSGEHQAPGVLLTGTTLASAGLLSISRKIDPEPIDSLFMGSAAAWGVLYGSVGQVALDTSLSDADAVLVTTLTADVGLALGGYILSDKTDITPTGTMVPQLCGVGGATLGSLGVYLTTESGQPVAIGTLAGATLGMAAGTVIAAKLDTGKATAASSWGLIPKPNIDLPGDWHFSALPATTQDGQMGAAISLGASGL